MINQQIGKQKSAARAPSLFAIREGSLRAAIRSLPSEMCRPRPGQAAAGGA